MKMNTGIICIGEALVDFIGHEQEKLISETRDYHRYLGGSATNVAMNLARLGLRPTLVASVGNDGLGDYILQRINEIEINSNYIAKIEEKPTSIVFVSRSTKTPDFIAYREADCYISLSQIPQSILKEVKIFHTTCFALSKNPAKETIMLKAKEAFELGCKLSIDINYSPKIWENREEARTIIETFCSYNPLVKISEDDMERYFEKHLTHEEIFDYFHALGVDVVCLTLGANGVKLSEKQKQVLVLPAIKIKEVMDATGAGDAFWSGFLYSYVNGNTLKESLEIALKLASLKLQHVGRLPNNINIISELLRDQV